MIVTAGHFFASYLFLLMQDCPNLNHWSCAVVEHGPQKSSLFCSWSHAERLSLVFEAPEMVARRAPSRLHLPTELRVHRTKQTLIFAFIAAQCTQSIKIHTSSLAEPRKINTLGPFLNMHVCECFGSAPVWLQSLCGLTVGTLPAARAEAKCSSGCSPSHSNSSASWSFSENTPVSLQQRAALQACLDQRGGFADPCRHRGVFIFFTVWWCIFILWCTRVKCVLVVSLKLQVSLKYYNST